MRSWTLTLLFLLHSSLYSWGGAALFSKYPNAHFVESGTYLGDGVRNALKAGFAHIHSVEIDPHYYKIVHRQFRRQKNVHLYLGNSIRILPQILQTIDEPITFWLDGHYIGEPQDLEGIRSPILLELQSILEHTIKTHTILIDDVRIFGTEEFDYATIASILEKLYEINPHYQITYEDGFIKNDVLVAYHPQS